MPQGVNPRKAVAQLTSPGYVIKDWINRQVVLVTEEGEIQHKYRGQEGFKPGGVVCHGRSIYVTDLNDDHVDELSVDGCHFRQLIRGQGVRRPTMMCVDDTGRLYVVQGEEKQEVWVIETPGGILIQQTNMNFSVTWCNYIDIKKQLVSVHIASNV